MNCKTNSIISGCKKCQYLSAVKSWDNKALWSLDYSAFLFLGQRKKFSLIPIVSNNWLYLGLRKYKSVVSKCSKLLVCRCCVCMGKYLLKHTSSLILDWVSFRLICLYRLTCFVYSLGGCGTPALKCRKWALNLLENISFPNFQTPWYLMFSHHLLDWIHRVRIY